MAAPVSTGKTEKHEIMLDPQEIPSARAKEGDRLLLSA